MQLTDAYCLFNRARGTEMVSPDDFMLACEMLDVLALPVRMRQYASGVLALHHANHNDQSTSGNLHAVWCVVTYQRRCLNCSLFLDH
jgi:ESCRT-II complex subunit VPS36